MLDTIMTLHGVNLLGRLGENEHRRMLFPISECTEMYPGAAYALIYHPPGATEGYPVATTSHDERYLYWIVTNSDLAAEGSGLCELIVLVDSVVAKSDIYKTKVLYALDGAGTPPPPWEGWQAEFARIKGEAEDAAEAAEDSATAALGSAQTAADASGAAVSARDAAQGYATAADNRARDAAGSATQAGQSAEAAQGSADAAGQSAEAAAGSAEGAAASGQAAAVARVGAVLAQGRAEDAQAGAEAARNTAEDYRDEVVGAAEGIAQQATAAQILETARQELAALQALIEVNRSVRWYDELPEEGVEGYVYITPDGVFHYHAGEYTQVSGGGDLNGFSLSLDGEDRVVLAYVNPEDETDIDEAVFPTGTTGAAILDELQNINAALRMMIPGATEG